MKGVTNRKVFKRKLTWFFMTFNHLEEKLQDRHINSYVNIFENLKEPTKTVLRYTLDIGSYLDEKDLRKKYALFGGYGVLSHLMEEFGESVALSWRGSTDIDMAGNQRVLEALKASYAMISDRKSPNVKNKRTLKLTENTEEECKIDFYMGNVEGILIPQTNTHFGIPLTVADPLSLIDGKLGTPESESVHSQDILAMLSILENRGYGSKEVTGRFQDKSKRKVLDDRIKDGMKTYEGTRIRFIPSKSFVKDIRRDLRKNRMVS